MKNGKPKGKTPSLIGGTLGAPRKRQVLKLSHCNRCNGDLAKGKECYEIPQLGGSFVKPAPYCDDCFRSILLKTKTDLELLLVAHGCAVGEDE